MLIGADLAALERAGKITLDPTPRGLARLGAHFQHSHIQPGQKRRRRDTSAHRTTTDDADFRHGSWLDAFELRQVRHGPFAEERVNHTLPLICLHEIEKDLAFRLQTF